MAAMTREEFKARWESSDNGGGITNNEVADCAEAWGLYSAARTANIREVTYRVLKEAQTVDCEEFNPQSAEEISIFNH